MAARRGAARSERRRMSGMGHQDGVDRPGGTPDHGRNPYIAPPHIRTTGEIPAVTGELPSRPGRAGRGHRDPAGPTGGDHGWPSGGSVVDRPPPSPPDWMSGVQIPELRVTRELDPNEVGQAGRGGFVETAQRVVGLVLVAILVAIVALVLASSVSRFGVQLP